MTSIETCLPFRPSLLGLNLFFALSAAFPAACRSEGDNNDSPGDVESDADDDVDADLDVDVDTDTDTDGDADIGTMVPVPAGTFTMGSPEDEVGRSSGEVQHEVTLMHAYSVGAYEVTQTEFEAAMGYQPSEHSGCPLCPVENLTWHEAAAYANAVSDAAGLDRCFSCTGSGVAVTCTSVGSPYDCEGYRLPTAAEWEKAARGGTTSAFSNGGDLVEKGDQYNCDGNLALTVGVLDDIAVYCGDSRDRSTEVGSKEPNPIGLYDVHGNIMEWCHDTVDEPAGYAGEDETDPWGDAEGDYRVERGGHFGSCPYDARSASRNYYDPHIYSIGRGFRLARTE